MKPSPFGYAAPASTDEALDVLAQVGHDAKVLAGGQSLLPILNMRLAAPGYLVDINRITELSYVRVEDGGVRVGALARHADVERRQRRSTRCRCCARRSTRRAPGDPQPGHDGRQPRACRPERRDDRGAGPHRWQRRGRRQGSSRDRACGRLLPRPARVGVQPGELAVSAFFPRSARRHRHRRSSRSPGGTATMPCAGSLPR